MKKVLFFCAFVAIAMAYVSCSEKKAEAKMLGDYELIEKGDLLGAKYDGYTVLAPEYEEITEQHSALFAKKNGKTTIVCKGSEVLTAEITAVAPTDDPDFLQLRTPDGIYLWRQGTGITRGIFDEAVIATLENGDKFIFCRDGNGWGVMNMETSLAPRRYEKVYIVSNSKTCAVLVFDKKNGWAMYKGSVTDGVKYDSPSKMLEKQFKKLGNLPSCGILNVDWKL